MDRDSRYADCETLTDGSLGLRLTPSISPNQNDQSHVVVAGDRLDALAYSYYGNSALWWIIADANAIAFSMDLAPNTRLRIPSLNSTMM